MFTTCTSSRISGPIGGFVLIATSSTSFAAQAFIDLGSLLQIPGVTVSSEAFDLSADGLTVVGQSLDLVGGVGQEMAFRWHAGVGMEALGHPAGGLWSKAFRVSPDGVRVGGSYRTTNSGPEFAFTWSRGAGSTDFQPIGLGFASPAPIVAIGDGEQFVVGASIGTGAIRWTPTGGSTVLPAPVLFPNFLPRGASRDGRAVIGSAFSSTGSSRAVLWREGVGTIELPMLAGYESALGTGISGDGLTAIGSFIDSTGTDFRSFVWTEAAGLTILGAGLPVDVNGDGTVVVFEGNPARIWTPAGGVQELRSVLTAAGAIVPPRPFEVHAVSDDGRAVAGWVSTPNLGASRHAFVAYLSLPVPGSVGTTYCSAVVPNSTGQPGVIEAFGSTLRSDEDLLVLATQLPQHVLALFLTSRTQGFVTNPGGSAGNLCLGGAIGRFSQSAQSTGSVGGALIAVDPGRVPSPTGLLSIQSGETWSFQVWHREAASSNFTEALAITFE